MSFLNKIHACNTANSDAYLPFLVENQAVGWLKPNFAHRLSDWPDVFSVDDKTIQISGNLIDFEARSDAADAVIRELVSSGAIAQYMDEPYPVTPGDRNDAMMAIDRAAASYFGIRSFGQHLNGYVKKADGLHLWVARRAADRRIFPHRLDNLVAGGLPWHTSLHENLLKECREEAGMSPELAGQATSVGTVSYVAESPIGIKPDTLYCYDLELPQDFIPVCTDGEVESFELMPIAAVMDIVRETDEFKPNCNLVIIDFIIRHGQLTTDESDYTKLVTDLHRSF